jgi:hypothetical protein
VTPAFLTISRPHEEISVSPRLALIPLSRADVLLAVPRGRATSATDGSGNNGAC